MKKIISSVISVVMLASMVFAPVNAAEGNTEQISYNYSYGMISGHSDSEVHTRQMEKLDRGLIAIKSGSGVYLSWRLWDSEDARFGSANKNVSFNVYRGNQKIATVEDKTNYTDNTVGESYSVAPVIDGKEGEKCEAVSVKNDSYFDIPLVKPANETIYEGDTPATKSFSPTDCSAGDLDGDGEYEIVVKWVSQEQDVGNGGYSGTVRFGAYKLDGTKLWDNDINLGKNVYSSAHTAQFLVYDFDGDGKAEMTVQTSLGSTDAKGRYVSHAAKADSVVASTNKKIAEYTDEDNENANFNGYDRKVSGEEFLTVFNGETGEAIDTIDLPTSRGSAKGVDYGDDFGNRSNRFVADVAYLDGVKPYAVYLRGYYFGKNGKQRTSIAGISFDGEKLSPDYRFDTQSGQPGYYEGAYQYVGQGNHNCTVADVDNDGKDEFITGALCMEVKDDNSFKPRWCTYLQHGDALHIGDYDPTHAGFEFFTVHEDDGVNNLSGKDIKMDFGMSVIDADTGEIIFHEGAAGDTGRGCMANVGMGGFYQFWSSGNELQIANGNNSFTRGSKSDFAINFRIFWDGDLYDELLDGVKLTNWNSSTRKMERDILPTNGKFYAINGTKANPSLQADLFGDWREEIIYPTSDGNNLRVFSTTTPTDYKIKTLMHDPVYRSGVAAEQTAYNQPPHVGMYLSEDLFGAEATKLEVISAPTKTTYAVGERLDTTGLVVKATYADGTSKNINSYFVSGYDPNTTGKQTVKLSYMNTEASFTVEVRGVQSIEIASLPSKTIYTPGEKFDATGLVVRAVYGKDSAGNITDYTISGFDSGTLGTQTITVSYMGKTAEFDITVKRLSGVAVASPPKNTNVYIGGSLDTAGLVVNAIYADGSSSPITNYTLSYNTDTAGETTVTVTYVRKTATFKINVIPPDIGSLNNTYATYSTESSLVTVPIGNYKNDFIIEHTVKINSMPASALTNGDGNRNNTDGFFVRFQPEASAKQGMGGGWVIVESGSKASIRWKASNDALTNIASINVGETYTFKYEFTDVGTESGAHVKLTIIDSAGKTVGTASDLDLRNMTFSTPHLGLALSSVQIYNQAKTDSESSVTFANARITDGGKNEIISVDGSLIRYTNGGGTTLYAADYDDDSGMLLSLKLHKINTLGEQQFDAGFAPDKVFMWDGMKPVDIWTN